MSQIITTHESVVLYPSSYSSANSSYSSASSISNGYTSSESTTRAQITMNTGASATSYISYTFNLSSIPEDATITSITCSAKASVSSAIYITSAYLQLYSGTTAKGSATSCRAATASEYDLTPGTWTKEELSDIQLRFTATRGTTSTTTARYMYFYGASLTINYYVTNTSYTVSSISYVKDIEIIPTNANVYEGTDQNIAFSLTDDAISHIQLLDNNVDVTSSLIRERGMTEISSSRVLGTYTLVSGTLQGNASTYFPNRVGKGIDGTSTTTNYYAYSSAGAVFTYNMPFNLPEGAIINNLYCQCIGHVDTSDSSAKMAVRLITGSTELSTQQKFTKKSKQILTLEPLFTPTLEQLSNMKLECTLGYNYGGAIYGATAYIDYSVPSEDENDYLYVYSLTNIDDDHTIVLNLTNTIPLYIKDASINVWYPTYKIYAKINGVWVEQNANYLSTNDIQYLKQGEIN